MPSPEDERRLQGKHSCKQERARDKCKHQEKDDLERFEGGFGGIDPGRNAERDHADHAKQCRDDFYCSRHPEEMVDAFGLLGNH